jgi:hypothetical protein
MFDMTQMSVWDWFLLFGLLILISIAYGLLIRTASEIG